MRVCVRACVREKLKQKKPPNPVSSYFCLVTARKGGKNCKSAGLRLKKKKKNVGGDVHEVTNGLPLSKACISAK